MLERLIAELWRLKGDRSFAAMADEAGLYEVTLWRVMNRQRSPSTETLTALLAAFPSLASVFVPENVPDGSESVPLGAE